MQSSTGMYNYSSSPSGITDPPSIVPVLMLCLLGVIGNSIAVTIVCCTARSHRWRPFHRYVCGLALTDGIGVMLALPFAIHRYTTNFQFTYSYSVCSYMSVVQMFTIIASAMIVCLMSIDRFMALICPYVYKSVKKGRHSTVTLACIWGVCAFLSSGHLMAGRSSRLFYPDSWCFVNFVSDNPTDLGFAFLYALTGLLVLVVTFITNMILLAIVLQRKCSKSSAIIANKHGTYIILFLFSIVLLFSICILPILINMLGHLFGTFEGWPSFELLGIEMATTNSIIDPWIYIIFRKETFSLAQTLYYKCLCIKRNTQSTGYQLRSDNSVTCTSSM